MKVLVLQITENKKKEIGKENFLSLSTLPFPFKQIRKKERKQSNTRYRELERQSLIHVNHFVCTAVNQSAEQVISEKHAVRRTYFLCVPDVKLPRLALSTG